MALCWHSAALAACICWGRRAGSLLPCTPEGWCSQCLVLGLTQSLTQCTAGHRQGRKANPPSPGCVCVLRAAACALHVSVGCASWEHPGVFLLDTSLWLPWKLWTKHQLGQARASPVTAARTGCLGLPCCAWNIVACSPSSPGILLTGRNLHAVIHGLSPLQLQKGMASVTSVVRGNVVSQDLASHISKA